MRISSPTTLLAVGLASLAIACNAIDAKPEAESIAEEMFAARRSQEPVAALRFYHPDFFEASTRQEWIEALETAESNLGPLQNHELEDWEVVVSTGGELRAGTYVNLLFKTHFSKGVAAEEVSIFSTPGESPGIISHRLSVQRP